MGQKKNNGRRPKYSNKKKFADRAFCGHCAIINKQLGADFDVYHDPNFCTKKKLSVSLIESFENYSNQEESADFTESEEGEQVSLCNQNQNSSLQRTDVSRLQPTLDSYAVSKKDNDFYNSSMPLMNPKPCDNNSAHDSNNMVNNISESLSTSNQILYAVSTDKIISCPSQSGTNKCTEKCENTVFSANVKNLNTSLYPWMKIQKSKSPRIRCFLKDLVVISLIDSGAEINVIDAITACNAGIEIIKT